MPLVPTTATLVVEGRERGLANVEARLRGVGRAGKTAVRSLQGTAMAADSMSRAMDNARRAAFRYTYYALIALRAGQMMLAAGMRRFFIEPAREAEEAIVRFAALSDEARSRIQEITEAAVEFAMKTPFAIADAAKAMENLYRTGRSVEEAMREAYDAAKLAVISGRDLAVEATFLGEVMTVFARTGITATQVVDQLSYAMTQSKYTIPELQAALENAMSAAIGFNQSFEQTLALITALGRAGVTASKAGNMLRRIFARMGMPKVNEFFEVLTEQWNEMNAAAIESGRILPAQLYTAEGTFGDLTRAVVASAEVLAKWREEAKELGVGQEYARGLQQLLYQIFGIRQIEPFLALAKLRYMGKEGVAAYDALVEAIRKATGYSEKYLKDLMATYSVARLQFQSSLRFFQITFGTPMLQMMNPALRILTEVINLLARLGQMVPTFRDVASSVAAAAIYGSALAGAFGMVWGILQIVKVRMIDIGEQVLDLARRGMQVNMIVRGLSREAALAMHPFQLGKMALFGGLVGPLKIALALVGLIGIGILAWKKNLGGFRDLLRDPLSRLREDLIDTGRVAERWSLRLKQTFIETRAWRAFWGGGFGQRRTYRTPALPEGMAFMGGARRMVIREEQGTFWRTLSAGLSGVLGVLKLGVRVFITAMRTVGAVLRGMFTAFAWIIGLGDTERGFRRLGEAIGYVAGAAGIGLFIWSLKQLGRALYWVVNKVFNAVLWSLSAIRKSFSAFVQQMLKIFIAWPLQALAKAIAFLRGGAGLEGLLTLLGRLRAGGGFAALASGVRGLLHRLFVYPLINVLRQAGVPQAAKQFIASLLGQGIYFVGMVFPKFFKWLTGKEYSAIRNIFGQFRRPTFLERWFPKLGWKAVPLYLRFLVTQVKFYFSFVIALIRRLVLLQDILVFLKKRELLQNIGRRIWDLLKSIFSWLSSAFTSLLIFLGATGGAGGLFGRRPLWQRGLEIEGARSLTQRFSQWLSRSRFGKLLSRIGSGIKNTFLTYVFPAAKAIGTWIWRGVSWLGRTIVGLPGALAAGIVLGWSVPGNAAEMEALRNLRRSWLYETMTLTPQGFAGFTGPATERPTLTIQNLSLTFSPTLQLKEGTPEEQARQMVEMVKMQLARALWELKDSQLELYLRGSENPLDFTGPSLSITPTSPLPPWWDEGGG